MLSSGITRQGGGDHTIMQRLLIVLRSKAIAEAGKLKFILSLIRLRKYRIEFSTHEDIQRLDGASSK
jgi:hypothetical protein